MTPPKNERLSAYLAEAKQRYCKLVVWREGHDPEVMNIVRASQVLSRRMFHLAKRLDTEEGYYVTGKFKILQIPVNIP